MASFHSNRHGSVWISALAVTVAISSLSVAAYRFAWRPGADDLAAGHQLFLHEFTVDDPICGDGDGLGPVFNERSCVACHFQGGTGGAGPNQFNVTAYEALPVPGRGHVAAGVVHAHATDSEFAESLDYQKSRFPTVKGAITTINGCSVQQADFDPLQVEQINTPALFGLGLIDELSASAISLHSAGVSLEKLGRELKGDFGGTGTGRLRTTASGRLGKFGWKGQFATLEDFVATACAMELGLTNHLVKQPVPHTGEANTAAQPDMDRRQLWQLVSYVRSLPRPVQVLPEDADRLDQVRLGEQLFSTVGCASCHTPDLGGVEGVYSDFRLYEVESDKVDDTYREPNFSPEFTLPSEHPRPAEWKTPPLWGVADSAPYFHDGQSPTLLAAIRRHGRDAASSRAGFVKLSKPEQQAILAFLATLRAPVVVDSGA